MEPQHPIHRSEPNWTSTIMNKNTTKSQESLPPENNTTAKGTSRRKFLSQVTAGLAGADVLGKAVSASGQSNTGDGGLPALGGGTHKRVKAFYDHRVRTAAQEAAIPVPPHTTNGDEAR